MIICGIDPGNTGAIAMLDIERWYLDVVPMPVDSKVSGKSTKNFVSERGVVEILDVARIGHVWIEHVSAMPKNGAVSMFNFGMGFGTVKTAAIALKKPMTLIKPNDWKKKMGLNASKEGSILRASELMPECSGFWERMYRGRMVHKDGMAEAALLAYFGAHAMGFIPKQPITPVIVSLAA